MPLSGLPLQTEQLQSHAATCCVLPCQARFEQLLSTIIRLLNHAQGCMHTYYDLTRHPLIKSQDCASLPGLVRCMDTHRTYQPGHYARADLLVFEVASIKGQVLVGERADGRHGLQLGIWLL